MEDVDTATAGGVGIAARDKAVSKWGAEVVEKLHPILGVFMLDRTELF